MPSDSIKRRVTVKPCEHPSELARAAAILHYFGGEADQAWLDRWLRFFELERMHAAYDGSPPDAAIVGGAGAFSFELTIPGGAVRAAGVTVVGVLPTHRRRGVLHALMRAQLDDVRSRGEPVACLWASEETIYVRYGYGLAVSGLEMSLARGDSAFRGRFEPIGQTRLVARGEALALLPEVYDRARRQTPGMLARSPAWWEHRRLADLPERRGGGGPLQHVVLEVDGQIDAYALYRMHFKIEHGSPCGKVEVLEAVGATPEATRSIWRYLLDIDWTARIEAAALPTDHVLRTLLASPRRAGFRLHDTLFVRLVDVGAALSARSYGAAESVVLDVRDDFCEHNRGRWRIGTDGVRRVDGDADLALDVSTLASLYLGGFGAFELARAGPIEERTEGAIARADALFRTDRAPWCPEIF